MYWGKSYGIHVAYPYTKRLMDEMCGCVCVSVSVSCLCVCVCQVWCNCQGYRGSDLRDDVLDSLHLKVVVGRNIVLKTLMFTGRESAARGLRKGHSLRVFVGMHDCK